MDQANNVKANMEQQMAEMQAQIHHMMSTINNDAAMPDQATSEQY
jgi:hypothetical protein